MHSKFLMSLLATPTVSGFESAGCSLYEDYVRDYVDECRRDTLGNSYAVLNTSEEFPKVMIEAHIDEIGFQVLYIADDGCIYIRKNGGVDIQCVPGSKVVICGSKGGVYGVIGKTPIHLLNNQEREKTPELSNLWIDTGLAAHEVKEKVRIGDVVAIRQNAELIGQHRITSKALDDKIGIYVVAEVIKRLGNERTSLRCNVQGVATVQEEVGCRGAMISGSTILPDISISIDVDFATDIPGCSKAKYGDLRLGEGVVVSCCLDSDMTIVEQLRKLAYDKKIPVQWSARPYATGGTNASRIRTTHQGVRTVLLGIPCRYMHTPVEMCDMRDVESAIHLIVEYVKQI